MTCHEPLPVALPGQHGEALPQVASFDAITNPAERARLTKIIRQLHSDIKGEFSDRSDERRDEVIEYVRQFLENCSENAVPLSEQLTNIGFRKQRAKTEHQVITAISLAEAQRCTAVHKALCGVLADLIDSCSVKLAQYMLHLSSDVGAGGKANIHAVDDHAQSLLSALSDTSALYTLSFVSDLHKAAQVYPPWSSLLQQPMATSVLIPRLSGTEAIYGRFLQSQQEGMTTWFDAWASFERVSSGRASSPELEQLLQLNVELLLTQTPEHLSQITFLLTLFQCLARTHPSGRRGAVELFAAACGRVHSSMHAEVGTVLASPPMPTSAARFFTLHAQMREALTRSVQLSGLLMTPAEAGHFRAQVASAQDAAVIHYVSDSTSAHVAALARHLSPAFLAQQPRIAQFLCGPFSRFIPVSDRQRLGLLTPAAPSGVDPSSACESACSSSTAVVVRCSNAHTARVPPHLLSQLPVLTDAVRLFRTWHTQGYVLDTSPPGSSRGAPANAHEGVPLPVSVYALNEVFDFAQICAYPPVLGGDAAQRQMKGAWLRNLQSSNGSSDLWAVRECALVVGFTELVSAVDEAAAVLGSMC